MPAATTDELAKAFEPLLDRRRLGELDPQGMLGRVQAFSNSARPAFLRGSSWNPPLARPSRVVVIGMGGSAISGDLARTLLATRWQVPISVVRYPGLPCYADAQTICIFSSYSGNTAETLAAFAIARKANLPIAVISSGGELSAAAAADDIPVLPLTGGWQPRAALGELYFTLLGMLSALGAPVDPDPALRRLEALSREYAPGQIGNQAQQLALLLAQSVSRVRPVSGALPLVAGVAGSTEAVALRWKCQFNENSKATVLGGTFPELTHNEIVNLAEVPVAERRNQAVLVLRDPDDPPLVQRQITETLALLSANAIEIQGEGTDPLERQLSLVSLGDHVSVYLALLKGIDPTPVRAIATLKTRMSQA